LSKNCQEVVKKLSRSCQKNCQQVVKKVVKKWSKKFSKSCQIYEKVGCKKIKILNRVGKEEGEEGEGEGDLSHLVKNRLSIEIQILIWRSSKYYFLMFALLMLLPFAGQCNKL
jgi:hypothetical protein